MKRTPTIILSMLLFCAVTLSACGTIGSQPNHSPTLSTDTQLPSESPATTPFIALGEVAPEVTEYGLLSVYDINTRLLSYTPIEIIDESDTQRIAQLEELGITPEFPNGYFVYQTSELLFTFPVSEEASVHLLNDEFTLTESSMEKLAERLEAHPLFFLCQLHIADGEIAGIEERFVP